MSTLNFRQRLLKWLYPLIMRLGADKKKGLRLKSPGQIRPSTSFYELEGVQNNGKDFPFSSLKGKKVLLVNTASLCGFTHQLEDLQKLYALGKEKIEMIGFPADDFNHQEPDSDEKINSFCKLNYGVEFPIFKKTKVVKGADQHAVYQWLTDSKKNGWNDHQPDWNFGKYILDESGKLTHYFGPAVSPLDEEVLRAMGQIK